MTVDSGQVELWAVTGPDYGRIWDHELVAAVMQITGNGRGIYSVESAGRGSLGFWLQLGRIPLRTWYFVGFPLGIVGSASRVGRLNEGCASTYRRWGRLTRVREEF